MDIDQQQVEFGESEEPGTTTFSESFNPTVSYSTEPFAMKEEDELGILDHGGLIFQQVESLDNLFVDGGREKPPKFINERFLLGTQLGQGSYGKVKQVLDTFTLQKLAVKIMNKQKLKKIPNGEQNAINEFKIMRKLNHKNVVLVYDLLQREAEPIEAANDTNNDAPEFSMTGAVRKPEKLYLLMEFCVCGLYDLLENAPEKKLPVWQAHKYFCDLLNGVEYLHSKRIIHKDIKPQNLLISPDETLKIADFGVAEELGMFAVDGTITSSAGTPMFQPPEVASGKSSFCGFKLDIWCTGVTLYNMRTGGYPFEGQNLYLLLENISKLPVNIPTHLSPQLQNLLKNMLEKSPDKRFSLSQVKSHRWVVQKHCVSPERVYIPHVQSSSHFTSINSSSEALTSKTTSQYKSLPHPPQQSAADHAPQAPAPSTSACNKSSSSFNYSYSPFSNTANCVPPGATAAADIGQSDFINSLEKIFQLADCESGKMESEDLLHVAGGGGEITMTPSTSAACSNNSKKAKRKTPSNNSRGHGQSERDQKGAPISSSYQSRRTKPEANGRSGAGTDQLQQPPQNSLPKIPSHTSTTNTGSTKAKKKACSIM